MFHLYSWSYLVLYILLINSDDYTLFQQILQFAFVSYAVGIQRVTSKAHVSGFV
jgi:hypothetical protein